MIYWSEFSWEAFATLATGFAAVAAAFFVGRRQLEILKRQTDIQEQSLRVSLFEKRYQVYHRTWKIIERTIGENKRTPEELHSEYLQAMLESRFLFDASVHPELVRIQEKVLQFDGLVLVREESERLNDGSAFSATMKDLTKLWADLSAELLRLPEIFHQLKIEKAGT